MNANEGDMKWAVYVEVPGTGHRIGGVAALFRHEADARNFVEKCFANPENGAVHPWNPPITFKAGATPVRKADGIWAVRNTAYTPDRVLGIYLDAPGLASEDVLAWHRNESGDWPDAPLEARYWPASMIPPGFVEKRREVAAEQAAKERMERDVRRAAKQKLIDLHAKEIARLEADLAALDAEDGAGKGQQPR